MFFLDILDSKIKKEAEKILEELEEIHQEERKRHPERYAKFDNKKREIIPTDVKEAVWRRDLGKCVQCSSNEKLEFDHIVPVSKGGSNTVRNIQLLCEKCNRKKSDKI